MIQRRQRRLLQLSSHRFESIKHKSPIQESGKLLIPTLEGPCKKDADRNVVWDADGNEVPQVLLEVDSIHKAILAQNRKHFHQADDTPFAGGAENTILYDLIGFNGMSKGACKVIEGTFLEKYGNKLSGLPEMEQVIRELAMPEEISILGQQIDCQILEKDFLSGFKGWKESTSMSPSGRHIGHYKAIVMDPNLKKQDQVQAHLCKHKSNFVNALVKLLNLPIQYGFAPKGWSKSVTVMIEKEPGNPCIK